MIEMARLNSLLIGLAALACTLGAEPLQAATHPVVVQFSPALPVAGQTVTARLSNDQSKAYEKGVDQFIGKPFTRETIFSAIENLVN